MTNHWIDIKNSKMIMVLGANPVENHPVVWQHILAAKSANSAKVLVADPRRTRTAAEADVFMRMRPGTNGALIMGLINYAITNNAFNATYISEKVPTRAFWGTRSDTSADEKATITATNATQNGVVLGGWPKWTDATFQLNADRTDYVRADVIVTLTGPDRTVTIPGMPVVLSDWQTNPDSVFSVMKARALNYDSATVADICDIPGGATAFETFALNVTAAASRGAGTILYAMGATQSSHASQDLHGYCMLQMLLGNMGMAGGGINALRGIHNVQGSTDMGLLYSEVPGYSGVPSVGQTYSAYQDKLFGNRKKSSAPYWDGIQQIGFRNMMWHYFHQGTDPIAAEINATDNSNFSLMPKGNGLNHRTMFVNAASGYNAGDKVRCMFVFGQNPAVTEPNLKAVKDGLYGLDTLVVVDMFETETAAVPRKPGGVTYLLPSAGFVEEEGSVTNSGRWIQWRNKAINPQGKSKSDTEILLTLASKLVDANAFTHITGATYAKLFGTPYGWAPATPDSSDFNASAATVAENIFKEFASDDTKAADAHYPGVDWGALWIYRGAYHPGAVDSTRDPMGTTTLPTGGWTAGANRAKSRQTNDLDAPNNKGMYPCWGWAWLHNRRIFYNNGQYGDVSDNMVAPDLVARFFVHGTNDPGKPTPVTYAASYRAYSTLSDVNGGDGSTTGGSATSGVYARMPKHWEPYETPREDLRTKYGVAGNAPLNGLNGGPRKLATDFDRPMVLTTIRVTEHFQGGPTTRNVPWLCELQPDAFIEINSADALALSIAEGDNVYVDTNRAVNCGPFKARVGTGTGSSQRVKKGTVAIPWHWGNRGISTGPSANTVTLDAMDDNMKMPEYKACLCRIHK